MSWRPQPPGTEGCRRVPRRLAPQVAAESPAAWLRGLPQSPPQPGSEGCRGGHRRRAICATMSLRPRRRGAGGPASLRPKAAVSRPEAEGGRPELRRLPDDSMKAAEAPCPGRARQSDGPFADCRWGRVTLAAGRWRRPGGRAARCRTGRHGLRPFRARRGTLPGHVMKILAGAFGIPRGCRPQPAEDRRGFLNLAGPGAPAHGRKPGGCRRFRDARAPRVGPASFCGVSSKSRAVPRRYPWRPRRGAWRARLRPAQRDRSRRGGGPTFPWKAVRPGSGWHGRPAMAVWAGQGADFLPEGGAGPFRLSREALVIPPATGGRLLMGRAARLRQARQAGGDPPGRAGGTTLSGTAGHGVSGWPRRTVQAHARETASSAKARAGFAGRCH
jgi:hypothetical protein